MKYSFVTRASVVLGALLCAVSSVRAQTISFGKSLLGGTSLTNPTSLQFGPDNRLYVTQQNGTILIYTVSRSGPNSYIASATETITLVRDILNHDDDGTPDPGVTGREVTGILVVGTAANPVIYVASSDPRIGAGSSGSDSNLDTNSGILSRLTWNGSAWIKLDLVRGLPRSEENHATNGIAMNAAGTMLWLAQGGNTNMGAPSNNFARLPEYALSAAVLSVNLTAIGNTTYDLPTLDDPLASRNTGTPGVDLNDPFGGNNAANQAKLVPGGPVQVYASGFRNPYDLVFNRAGRLYTIDNGPNAGWGDVPIGEGGPSCTNAIHEPGQSLNDQLHYITGSGFYGGHPNPTRGNKNNTFNGQSPVTVSDPVQCDYRQPGVNDGALATFGSSTNGIAEYTASNFGGAMDGNLLAASFDNNIYRIVLSADGTQATSVTTLFSSVGGTPLDVWAQGAAGPFTGTIWVADYANNDIVVYEPNDFISCTGAYSTTLDEDGDCFSNADEIDNGTNPCSAGDVPPDFDHDCLSNLNDPDDDNDGLPDTTDKFAVDANNGMTTNLPLLLTWDNTASHPGGLLDLGFTGLMTNGTSNYASLYDPSKMTAGGAAGVTTVDQVAEGDALNGTNTQQYGFQAGVHISPATGVFTAHTRVLGPFAGLTPADFQSMGLFVGTGDQDHYVKAVLVANAGAGGVQFGAEIAGSFVADPIVPLTLPGPDWVDLYLTVDPVADTVQPAFIATIGGVAGALTSLGPAQPIPAAWVSGTQALAVGIISTSRGPAPPFPATWDFLKVLQGEAVECSVDAQCDDGNPCTDDVCQSFTCLHLNNTNPCDDGISCTSGDVCAAGACSGTDSCPAGQACNAAQNACVVINADLDNDGLVGAADPCPLDPRNLCFGPVATDTAQNKALRINAGVVSGGACAGVRTDCAGGVWNADFGYNQSASGFACDLNGGGTGCVFSGVTTLFGCDSSATEDLFRCEHWDDVPAPELSYAFTVPNGPYLVNLYFANAYHGTVNVGDRIFNILIEGQTVYANFDQVAAAGGSAIAVVRSAVVNVADGVLNISFGHVTENPAVKAIEVLRQDLDHDGFFPPNDCNDLNPAVHPGASDANCNGIDENCSGVADEGYVSTATTCGVGACGRTGATSCVSGAVRDSCVPGAPTTEVCNGVDDNCDGIIDNAAPLTAIAELDIALSGTTGTALSWPAVAGASAYDVLRGDAGTLISTGGNFGQAITTCLADNMASLGTTDAAVPQPDAAFFYLLRGVNCTGGSWESGDAAQVAPRNPLIAAAPLACP